MAASLVNAGRQIGGSIGLAVLGTVAWTVVADSARTPAAAGAASPTPAATWQAAAAYRHALAVGFDRAFLVAARDRRPHPRGRHHHDPRPPR